MKEVIIDPITRLEGHGKIAIFLNEAGEVENAYLQVPELRGFERFCIGRKAEDMPLLTSRICGVCPVAHHMAGTKALDAAFNVEPPEPAKKLRELMYCGYYIYDHTLHFYYLGGPDFIVGPKAPAEKRNILGVIEKAGIDIAKEVIKHRAYGQKITEIVGGKATHPVCGLPGGVSKSISEEERREIENMATSAVNFAQLTLKIFHDLVLGNTEYVDLIKSGAYTLHTHYMGLVDENNKVNLYDGKIRVVDPYGKEFVKFEAKDYLNHIAEHVEPWTYVKFPYLRKLGWKGFVDGPDSGIYRVGPLARLNASDGMATPLAQAEYELMYKTLGGKPVHSTLAYHWARLIELLYAAERAVELVKDPEITSTNIRNKPGEPGEGVGVVEAARGTLIHHYVLDKDALVKDVNLIVATVNNAPSINMSVRNAAKGLIHGEKVDPGLLNMVEMAFRAYDPCFGCATHYAIGQMPLTLEIYNANGKLVKTVQR
ncbi:MAG: Ni/Fe hydrogenase subunit alpha [Candidatus Bathyarchaeota archaeon]|nr:Ni/Fe hydrogenase subunit alpha [Candidatus Bathyarchaeota archaeon]MCX8177627.1 Ni/Fe hydrogenase subunit alpha [Candidatus Bathyarchaeota archaeon]MDW8193884.1 Ni/Fe hydrogenase subunit alpha [Nitrososphaerota archaeon]